MYLYEVPYDSVIFLSTFKRVSAFAACIKLSKGSMLILKDNFRIAEVNTFPMFENYPNLSEMSNKKAGKLRS